LALGHRGVERRCAGAGLSDPADPLGGRLRGRGTTDFMARLLADKLRGPLGQPVVVENRTGANGALAPRWWRSRSPTAPRSISPPRASRPSIRICGRRPTTRSRIFARGRPGGVQLHHAGGECATKINSAQDLAALARQNPGTITIAITGLGSVSHLGAELFQAAAGIKLSRCPIGAPRPP